MKTVRIALADSKGSDDTAFARDYTKAWTIVQHEVKPTVLAWAYIL